MGDHHAQHLPCLRSMGSPPEPQEETMRAARPRPILAGACTAIRLMVVAGCTGLGTDEAKGGLSCLDDSPECVGQRQTALKSMLADKDRSWLKEPATAEAHASGVRLFAFRSKKAEMTCD